MCEIQCLIFELYTNMVGGGQISHNSSIKRFFVQVSSCITTWKGCTLKFLTFFALVHAMPYPPVIIQRPGLRPRPPITLYFLTRTIVTLFLEFFTVPFLQ